ncbi:Fis family transcriptional regulator [Gordonia sp. HY285]|uniref:helix-turn-helix domain-containing protein n=1 Tax=Gordonia liuliyuniae TaxID=2911517 RepID=UPI001F1DA8C2|nr:helix-turn-helix domain-containing protein [Gordonia liuliyuniae]MCF8612082.1 Fis family transcriptional regulator [Gordonia liuliyuniae]
MTTSLPHRDVIAASWQRVASSGLQRDARPVPNVSDIASADPLLDAARPVLARAVEILSGTETALLLVDSESRMVARVSADATLENRLSDAGAVDGAAFGEDAMGTTALGTTAEVRGDVVINGGEHYLEQFRSLSCFGRPIIHPATRRLAGIICMTEVADRVNPLSVPLIRGLVDDIAERLLNRTHTDHRAVVSAFERASARRDTAVAAVGDDLQLTNSLAAQLLAPGDFGTLALLVGERNAPPAITLVSGVVADVAVDRVPGVRHAAVFRLRPRIEDAVPASPLRLPSEIAATTAICGEAGTGRTTHAYTRVPPEDATTIDVAASILDGSPVDVAAVLRTARMSGRGVIIDGADLLDERSMRLLHAAVAGRGSSDPALVVVTGPVESLSSPAAALTACCTRRIILPPLRQRTTELASIGQEVLQRIDSRVKLQSDAADALVCQEWPGNLIELTIVLRRAVDSALARGSRAIGAIDLPEEYRGSTRASKLLGLEQAERLAIQEALDVARGNKSHAASALGISRTTLYARIRALGI